MHMWQDQVWPHSHSTEIETYFLEESFLLLTATVTGHFNASLRAKIKKIIFFYFYKHNVECVKQLPLGKKTYFPREVCFDNLVSLFI